MGGGFDLHWRSCLGRRCMSGAAPAGGGGGGGRMEDEGGSERRILLRLSRRLRPPPLSLSLLLRCTESFSHLAAQWGPRDAALPLAAPRTPPYLARFSPPSSPLLFFTTPSSLTCLSTLPPSFTPLPQCSWGTPLPPPHPAGQTRHRALCGVTATI